jgi:hypothetical protein
MSITINDAHLIFNGEQRHRATTSVIVIHHTAETVLQSVQVIHNYYLNRKDPDGSTYIGIAYNYYVRKDGSIWKGREEWAIGGHAGAVANPISIGICFEGNYETEPTMPDAQFNAGVALIKDIFTRYPGLAIKKHKDYMNTACPGVNFPFDRLVIGVTAPVAAPVATPKPTASTFPGAQYFGPGKVNDHILALDRALIAKGYSKYYALGKFGASRSWGNGTFKACTAFQKAQGWSGSDANGIPGPQTWARLGL